MVAVAKARAAVMEADARRIISTGLARPLRNNAREVYVHGEAIQVFQRLGGEAARWHSGYRVITVVKRHVIAERGAGALKIAAFQARGSNADKKRRR